MKLKIKNKKAVLIITLIALSVLVLSQQLSVYIPQTDISYTISKITAVYDTGIEETWYPNTPSFSYDFGRETQEPEIVVATNVRHVQALSEKQVTFGEKKYKVYSWECYFDIEIKAVSEAPWKERIELPGGRGYVEEWKGDLAVTVTVYLKLYSRGSWYLLYAVSDEIEEVVRWTSAETPSSDWKFKIDGYANALEPTADNQILTVLTDYNVKNVDYYYDVEEFYRAGSVDGKMLMFKAELQPPSAGWNEWKWFRTIQHRAFGEAFVTVSFKLTVCYTVEIPPEQPTQEEIPKLNDTKPKVEPYNEPTPPIIPPFLQIVIIILLIITAVYVILTGIAKLKPTPQITIGGNS